MVPKNLLANRKPQSNSIALSIAGERLEQLGPNRLGDARPVIFNTNLDAVFAFTEANPDFSRVWRHHLASIQQHVGKDPLNLLLVKPGFASPLAAHRDVYALNLGTRAHGMDSPFQCNLDRAEHPSQGLPCLGEFEKGINKISKLINRRADFSV